MEAMRRDLVSKGYSVNIVGINMIGAESTQAELTSRASFDFLQDVAGVEAWKLLDGGKDDIFIYTAGGTLAPGGYLRYGGPVSTDLSSREGYMNVFDLIVKAHDLGTTECGGPPRGLQLPGNINQDSRLDLSDAVTLLGHLFQGLSALPCEDGEGNQTLSDVNGDERVDIADPVHILNYLFTGGSPPSSGTACVGMAGCPDACSI